MDVRESDIILTVVSGMSKNGVRGSTSYWDNLSELVITPHNTNKEIVLGQDLTVEIEKITDGTAFGRTKRAPYARHIFPGDEIEVTPTHFTDDGLAIAAYSGSTFDTVHVTNAVPQETVVVRILKISGRLAIGEAVETLTPGLEVGDQLDVTVEAGTSTGNPEDGVFDIDLRTEAPLTADITVEITDLDGSVQADIVDPGILPLPGRELQADIERNSKRARIPNGDYEVRLSAPALATGRAKVEIDQATSDEMPLASIASYGNLIPELGDTVQVWSIAGTSEAKPVDGTYRVQLSGEIPVRTLFEVEITNREKTIDGKLAAKGSLPLPDNAVEAMVEQGETRAKAVDGEYPIDLQHPSLLTGQVTVIVDSPPGDEVTKGRIDSYQNQLPSIGEELSAVSVRGQPTAKPDEGTYEIELDETPPLQAKIEVEVTGVSETEIDGTIVDQGIIPNAGDKVRGDAILDKKWVRVKDDYRIHVGSPALASGAVTVRIDSISSDRVSGRILNHHTLPNVGEKVRAKINSFDKVATPLEGRYRIHLQSTKERGGKAVVEITAINSKVEGKVLEFESRDSNHKSPMKSSSSMNDLISSGKL